MVSRKEKNMRDIGYILGVLHSSEMVMKSGTDPILAQNLINQLLDGKMKYLYIKRLAKQHKVDLDWKKMDITIQRTD